MAEFRQDHTTCQDQYRSDRPNEVTTSKIVKKIRKMVLNDRRQKMSELAYMAGISENAIHRILTENLDKRKLCVSRVLCLFILEQRQQREDINLMVSTEASW